MNASTTAITSPAKAIDSSRGESYGAAFWEQMWRTSGLQFAGFFIERSRNSEDDVLLGKRAVFPVLIPRFAHGDQEFRRDFHRR